MSLAKKTMTNVKSSLLAVTLLGGMAFGATSALAADTNSAYQKERAACFNGQSNQDRATCLREANNARGEAKRGNLNDGAVSYDQNATTRCSALPAADQQDCMQRIRGTGSVSGSVEAGGVYRETRTTIVEPQPASGTSYQAQPRP